MDANSPRPIESSRLVAARLARKHSRVDVAKAINCSDSYYGDMEAGHRRADKYLHLISEFLKFPESFFYGDALPVPRSDTFSYRRRISMKKADRDCVEQFGAIFGCDLLKLLTQYVKLPDVTVPDLSSQVFQENPLEYAEASSAIIRSQFQMSNAPLRSAIDLVESMGVMVFWVDGPEEFDGVSFWIEERPFMLLNRNRHDGYRMRFTVLHELLHICAHRNLSETGKAEDKQADAFASAMLMPASTFRKSFGGTIRLHSLLEDRSIWGASVRAQVRRAYDLGLIGEWGYKDSFMKMNMMWKRLEPNPCSVESSSVHTFFFEEAGDRGKYSEDLATESGLSYYDFLCAMPLAAQFEKRNFSPGFQ